jgi:hypothetical protein
VGLDRLPATWEGSLSATWEGYLFFRLPGRDISWEGYLRDISFWPAASTPPSPSLRSSPKRTATTSGSLHDRASYTATTYLSDAPQTVRCPALVNEHWASCFSSLGLPDAAALDSRERSQGRFLSRHPSAPTAPLSCAVKVSFASTCPESASGSARRIHADRGRSTLRLAGITKLLRCLGVRATLCCSLCMGDPFICPPGAIHNITDTAPGEGRTGTQYSRSSVLTVRGTYLRLIFLRQNYSHTRGANTPPRRKEQ